MIHDGGLGLRRIRQHWLTCMLIVTGTTDSGNAEQPMNIGADDAMIAGPPLVGPRLRAAAGRARIVNAGTRIAIGDIIFDRESRRMWCAGHEVRLTRTEEELLDCLLWYAPRAVSIAELSSFALPRDGERERSNLIHVYIGYLRRKLKVSQQVVIRSVRGMGYRFAERKHEVAD